MSKIEKTYYELLGLKRDASTDQIREAYRELARIYHPDSNFYNEIIETDLDPEALSKFKVITAAYNTLVSPEKRKEYDRTLPGERLQGWDEGSAAEDEAPGAHTTSRRSTPSAFGTFGHVRTNPNRAQQTEEVQSVADIITKKRKLYRRLLSVFGL